MISSTVFRNNTMTLFAALVLLVLSLGIVGCGDGEKQEHAVKDRSEPVKQEPSVVEEPSPPATEALPAQDTVQEEEGVEEAPRTVSYEEAEIAFFEKRYGEAVELFTSYTDRKGENPWGFYMLGLSAWKAGEYDVASTAFEQALALDPRHIKSLLNWSRVLLDTDRPRQALAKLDEAIERDPESGVAFRLLGRAYHQLGQLEEAVGAYRQAILLDDEDAWAMNNLGLILIEEGMFDRALPPLARAVELRNDISVFYNNLGMALERSGDYRAALNAYERALALDSTSVRALANLGRVTEVVEAGPMTSFPIDLAEQSSIFEDEIDGWHDDIGRAELTVTDEPTSLEDSGVSESGYEEDAETAMVEDADSTSSDTH